MEGKLFFRQYLIWMLILLWQLHGYTSCIVEERIALLELKKFMISLTEEGESDSVFPTWTNDTTSDCCQWNNIKCNPTSRRVIELIIGEFEVKEGSLFNISVMYPFEELQNLDLSWSSFSGFFDDVEGYNGLKRLRNLEFLDLSSSLFNNSIFPFITAATSLTTLFLQDNRMNCPFPDKELSALVKLKALDLSGNGFSSSMELQGICKLKNLQELDLSRNNLEGQFSLCLTSLTGLRVLDLSSNQITGKLPSALSKLESLEYLTLFNNNFKGFFSLDPLANLSNLKVFGLDSRSNSLQVVSESSWKPRFQLNVIALRSCNLKNVPHFLLHQKDLRHVDLSNNNILGNFPSWLLANNTELEALLLRKNHLTSFQLPKSPHDLQFLDVSVNDFGHLFPENIGWILHHLQSMNISKNGFQGNLPSSLGNMKSIEVLDISHNSFQGMLPISLVKGCYSLKTLKLSHNKLSGKVFQEPANFTRVSLLYMDNNQFTGKIGFQSFRSLYVFDISNNSFRGVIPSWIGENHLGYLLISDNLLHGEIPIFLFNISSLRLLDLSANMLSGSLPPQVNSRKPVVLYLQDNNFSGSIPNTLLTNADVLDLRNNRLSGNIPEFVDTKTINILLLRGNNLSGRIPHQLCGLSNIHLLDLSNNLLNGSIPSCLSNTSLGLRNTDESYGYSLGLVVLPPGYFTSRNYFSSLGLKMSVSVFDQFHLAYMSDTKYEIEFATKYRYDTYMGANLKLLVGLDLSENELSGEIPVEFGDLLKLNALNLSHNNLSGVIPESFSGLKNVESLDLSFNRLQGWIPSQLAELTSLAIFKVSYNNLSGVIPKGRQFNTFDTESFLGNPLLCGEQINKSCNNSTSQEPDIQMEDDESLIDMESFYWSFVAVFVTILIGIFAFLSFDSPWRRTWFYIVDAFIHKVRNLMW